MVDILALALSHGLLALAAWRLLFRPDLDEEAGGERAAPEADSSRRQPNHRLPNQRKPVRREMRWPGRGDDRGGDA